MAKPLKSLPFHSASTLSMWSIILLLTTIITLLHPVHINAVKDEQLVPNEYRWFAQFTIIFKSKLYDLNAFDTLVMTLPKLLGRSCFFHTDVFSYEPIPSVQQNAYDFFTVLPTTLTGPLLTIDPPQSQATAVLSHFDEFCGDMHLDRVILELNKLLPTLQIDRIVTDVDVFNQACVISRSNPLYTSAPLPARVDNKPNRKLQQIIANQNGINTSTDGTSTLPPVVEFDIDVEEEFVEHHHYGHNCPRAAELMQCESNLDCQTEAGSTCKWHFNRTLKRNLQYCSIVNRWKDPKWTNIFLGSTLVLIVLWFVKVLVELNLINRILLCTNESKNNNVNSSTKGHLDGKKKQLQHIQDQFQYHTNNDDMMEPPFIDRQSECSSGCFENIVLTFSRLTTLITEAIKTNLFLSSPKQGYSRVSQSLPSEVDCELASLDIDKDKNFDSSNPNFARQPHEKGIDTTQTSQHGDVCAEFTYIIPQTQSQ